MGISQGPYGTEKKIDLSPRHIPAHWLGELELQAKGVKNISFAQLVGSQLIIRTREADYQTPFGRVLDIVDNFSRTPGLPVGVGRERQVQPSSASTTRHSRSTKSHRRRK